MRQTVIYLALLLGVSATAAKAEWVEVSSRHFVVYANGKAEDAKAISTRLERFDRAMRVFHGIEDDKRGPSSRISVFVVNDVEAVRKVFGNAKSSVAGFMESRASGSVAFVPKQSEGDLSAQAVLFHEYSHHFMFSDWPTAVFPSWYREGFAEFHATAIMGADGSVTFGAAPAYRRYTVAQTNLLPLPRLLRLDPGRLSDEETDALYSRGWTLTHYLTFDTERRKQLADYVAAINAGKSVQEATKVFGNLNLLDLRLTNYALQPKLQSARFTANELPVGPITVRRLTAGEAATMPARIVSRAGVDMKRGQKIVALAREEAAPFPNDAGAQNELAEAEFDTENFGASEAAADRALAADPQSIHAHEYKGMARQAIATAAKSTDTNAWRDIRRQYLAANKLDPEDPQPLILYYESFAAAHQPVPKSAEDGLLYAYVLAPFDLSLRVSAARVYLARSDVPNARSALLPVVYNTDKRDSAKALKDVVVALDSGGAAAALAAFKDYDAKQAEEKAKAKAKAKG